MQTKQVVDAVQCQEECKELYIVETKQPLHKQMGQHRRAVSSGQDSAIHAHPKGSRHSFEDSQACAMVRGSVKEAIHAKLENPSWIRGGGLRHFLSPTFNAVLHSFCQQSKQSLVQRLMVYKGSIFRLWPQWAQSWKTRNILGKPKQSSCTRRANFGLPFDLSLLCYCFQTQLERFTSMRMKKEKTGQISGQRHTSASSYEMSSQSGMLQDHSDEYILELFEKMLVSKALLFLFPLI